MVRGTPTKDSATELIYPRRWGYDEPPKSAIAFELCARTPLYHAGPFAGCPVVEINKRQINEPRQDKWRRIVHGRTESWPAYLFRPCASGARGPSRPNTATWLRRWTDTAAPIFFLFPGYTVATRSVTRLHLPRFATSVLRAGGRFRFYVVLNASSSANLYGFEFHFCTRDRQELLGMIS